MWPKHESMQYTIVIIFGIALSDEACDEVESTDTMKVAKSAAISGVKEITASGSPAEDHGYADQMSSEAIATPQTDLLAGTGDKGIDGHEDAPIAAAKSTTGRHHAQTIFNKI